MKISSPSESSVNSPELFGVAFLGGVACVGGGEEGVGLLGRLPLNKSVPPNMDTAPAGFFLCTHTYTSHVHTYHTRAHAHMHTHTHREHTLSWWVVSYLELGQTDHHLPQGIVSLLVWGILIGRLLRQYPHH